MVSTCGLMHVHAHHSHLAVCNACMLTCSAISQNPACLCLHTLLLAFLLRVIVLTYYVAEVESAIFAILPLYSCVRNLGRSCGDLVVKPRNLGCDSQNGPDKTRCELIKKAVHEAVYGLFLRAFACTAYGRRVAHEMRRVLKHSSKF